MAKQKAPLQSYFVQYRWVRRLSSLSLVICFFLMAFFSLANAGITKYTPFASATGAFLIGLYAATVLRERANRLDLNGLQASRSIVQCAVALPVLLILAFAILLTIQFS